MRSKLRECLTDKASQLAKQRLDICALIKFSIFPQHPSKFVHVRAITRAFLHAVIEDIVLKNRFECSFGRFIVRGYVPTGSAVHPKLVE